MVAAAIVGGSAISGISGLIGSQTAAGGAQQAANTNLAAQQLANMTSLQEQQNAQGFLREMFGRAQEIGAQYPAIATTYEQPLLNLGVGTAQNLTNELNTGQLGAMPSLTDLSGLPGYQFTLTQGQRAAQNAAAAQGLGVSGPALRGAIDYSENLANTFSSQYLNNYWANQNNRYNMLAGVANLGANAANQIATIYGNTGNALIAGETGTGTSGANAAINTGNTIAATTTGTAQQIANAQQNAANIQAAGFNNFGNSASSGLLFNALLNRGGGSTISPTDAVAGTGGLY